MSGHLNFDIVSNGGISKAIISSKIDFKQRVPVPQVNSRSTYYSTNVFEENGYSFYSALKEYERRDFRIQPRYNSIVTGGQSMDKVQISLEINMDNEQSVYYEYQMLTMIKLAWMQFFPIFIPFWIVARQFLMYLLRYNFISSRKIDNLPREIAAPNN
ncbi:hypothetical protein PPERSA_10378 [Pseudocohnilembus persalinus]|uniref:Transmembrane protein 231 n=1 Tax=Pseudocohnilembus persalinus TaxID=266149 RepID=A0A0V0R237_PSEPJ|nr:hypothetical protein PPERSA_10378 [Pseudocohnilembus persalinus]|eukprot:KRX08574.1 hypothetical protein PPERSA_10378 [Pseudocohnilembus persalinus]